MHLGVLDVHSAGVNRSGWCIEVWSVVGCIDWVVQLYEKDGQLFQVSKLCLRFQQGNLDILPFKHWAY